MANRTTATEVKEILETELDDDIVTAFIDAANELVTELLGTSSLSVTRLAMIEKWLSAHMVASTREQQAKSENAGGAGITYQGETAMGLDATMYGQQVKMLDTTGTLAQKIGKARARITAVTSFE